MKNKTLREEFVKRFYGFDEIEKRGSFSLDIKQVDEVWNFIEKALTQREAEVREEIIEKLPRVKYYEYSTDHNDGYTEGQEDYRNSIIQSLNQNTK